MLIHATNELVELHKAGSARVLATSGPQRSAIMPDVPTLAEAGVPGYEATIWLGVMAPRGTPAAVVGRLNAEIARVTGNPDVRKAWAAQGTSAMTMNVDEFTRYLNDDIAKWTRIVRAASLKPE